MSGDLLDRDFATLADLIRSHAEARPEHPALIIDDKITSFGELDRLIDRVAVALQRTGVGPVALVAGNSLEWIAVFLGALRAGVVVAPMQTTARPEALARMIADAEARVIFADRARLLELANVRPRIDARMIALDDEGGTDSFRAWIAPPDARADATDVDPEDPCNLIYSSGTTGRPKGIVQPYAMRWAHARRGALLGYGPRSITIVALPLWSNSALVSFFPALGSGGAVVVMRRFEVDAFLALSSRHRVTHAMLVPVLFRRILAHPELDRTDLSSFEQKTCTSAPFPAALKAEVLRRWPGKLTEFYGMSEGGGATMLLAHDHPDKLHTVGCPLPGHEIRLIRDNGSEAGLGEAGEIVGRSPAMMTGYHRLPEESSAAEWFDPQGRRFIRTGDIGRLEEDGFLVLLDRKKDMLISGGANIYPRDLEDVLGTHPDVQDVAVVGIPSAKWGETPIAFAVLRPDRAVGEEELVAYANARLGKTQRVSAVEIVSSLPRNAIGKVLKRELREAYLEREGRKVPPPACGARPDRDTEP